MVSFLGRAGLSHPTEWMVSAILEIKRIRVQALKAGNSVINDVGPNNAEKAMVAISRLTKKILQVITVGNDRLICRGVVPMEASRCAGVPYRNVALARGTTGVPYGVYDFGNFRTDCGWSMEYFLIVHGILVAHGATEEQAQYMSCCALIELVGITYGQRPIADWGLDPNDFGVSTPCELPVF